MRDGCRSAPLYWSLLYVHVPVRPRKGRGVIVCVSACVGVSPVAVPCLCARGSKMTLCRT